MRRLSVALVTAVALTACGGGSATAGPASRQLDRVEWVTGAEPNGTNYSFVTGCLGRNRVFLRANAIAAVGDDPTCMGAP